MLGPQRVGHGSTVVQFNGSEQRRIGGVHRRQPVAASLVGVGQVGGQRRSKPVSSTPITAVIRVAETWCESVAFTSGGLQRRERQS
jgi:hypothetical protein